MVRDWLESRKPPPPPNLAARLAAAFGAATPDSQRSSSRPPVSSLSEPLIAAAEAILEPMMSRAPGDAGPHSTATGVDRSVRTTAVDLLAADALITYSLEAAADDHESFTSTTHVIVGRLARLVGERSPG